MNTIFIINLFIYWYLNIFLNYKFRQISKFIEQIIAFYIVFLHLDFLFFLLLLLLVVILFIILIVLIWFLLNLFLLFTQEPLLAWHLYLGFFLFLLDLLGFILCIKLFLPSIKWLNCDWSERAEFRFLENLIFLFNKLFFVFHVCFSFH